MHCKLMAIIYYQRVKCRSLGACAAIPEHLKNLKVSDFILLLFSFQDAEQLSLRCVYL